MKNFLRLLMKAMPMGKGFTRHRMPLPHISGSLPSLLKMRML